MMPGPASTGPAQPPGESLLRAYQRWREAQESPAGRTPAERMLQSRLAKVGAEQTARQIATVAKASEIEADAFRRSVKKVALAAEGGASPKSAILYGYKAYRKRGGSASLETWRRRVAAGRR